MNTGKSSNRKRENVIDWKSNVNLDKNVLLLKVYEILFWLSNA